MTATKDVGQQDININNVGYLIYWLVFNKGGNVNPKNRCNLLLSIFFDFIG